MNWQFQVSVEFCKEYFLPMNGASEVRHSGCMQFTAGAAFLLAAHAGKRIYGSESNKQSCVSDGLTRAKKSGQGEVKKPYARSSFLA